MANSNKLGIFFIVAGVATSNCGSTIEFLGVISVLVGVYLIIK